MTHVQVKTKSPTEFAQEIKGATQTFSSDAPEAVGGGAKGPDPHELLLGSLGACTSITIQMYAKKKGWNLEGVSVDCKEEQVDDPQNPGKKMAKISRDIHVQGDFDAEQIESLKGAAERCPIHKILSAGNKIDTALSKN